MNEGNNTQSRRPAEKFPKRRTSHERTRSCLSDMWLHENPSYHLTSRNEPPS